MAVLTHLLHEAQGEAGDQEAAGKLPSGYRKTLLLAVLGLVWYVLVFLALIFLLLSITQDRDASSVVEPVRKLLGAYDDKTLAAVTGPDSFLSWIETGLLPSLGPRVGAECGLTVDTPLPPSPAGAKVLLADNFSRGTWRANGSDPIWEWDTPPRMCRGKLLLSSTSQTGEIRARAAIVHDFLAAPLVVEGGVGDAGLLPGHGLSVCNGARLCVNATLGTAPMLLRIAKQARFCDMAGGGGGGCHAQVGGSTHPDTCLHKYASLTPVSLSLARSPRARVHHIGATRHAQIGIAEAATAVASAAPARHACQRDPKLTSSALGLKVPPLRAHG